MERTEFFKTEGGIKTNTNGITVKGKFSAKEGLPTAEQLLVNIVIRKLS